MSGRRLFIVQGVVILGVAIVVVLVAGQTALEIADGWETVLCQDRAGEVFEYVNGSLSHDNKTIACEAPNGTVKRVSALVNATS